MHAPCYPELNCIFPISSLDLLQLQEIKGTLCSYTTPPLKQLASHERSATFHHPQTIQIFTESQKEGRGAASRHQDQNRNTAREVEAGSTTVLWPRKAHLCPASPQVTTFSDVPMNRTEKWGRY